ncbi:unnamed protein product [Clonostachys solani]|uniref:Protein-arginine deiminase C-terminal domain-containing protein n=1 Tax=Clonostachys solani TaxID=160281 RepID=A0A9P0ENC1_9HYPO|nr:unnamed protein product [Clonostachys solani]
MAPYSLRTAILILAACRASHALTATILADTNRDGKVDITGDTDAVGKQSWTAERGALFLPNVVDTDRRCSVTATDVETMHLCHDATDNVLRQQDYLAPIRTVPTKGLSENAVGVINVTDSTATEFVRIFYKNQGSWSFLEEDHKFTAAQLSDGLELGIDGRDVRRPETWDGRATVYFTVTDGEESATDFVELRVAPYLTHHHVQLAQQSFVSNWNRVYLQRFAEEFATHNDDAGLPQSPVQLSGADIWVQDYFETGYASIPGPSGPIAIRIILQSIQRRSAGRYLFSELRNEKVGAINYPQSWDSDQTYWGETYDSTGNLETIPPYTYNGKSYPAGRIIIGEGDTSPLVLPFLQLQETQDPIILDTSWLAVGHVDEFIQFIPANNERGWVVMAEDPLAGVALLKKAQADGYGSLRALSRDVFTYDPYDGAHAPCVPQSTIDFELARTDVDRVNQYAADKIQANLEIIKRETGISDADIFRVPGFVSSSSRWTCSNSLVSSAKFPATQDDDKPLDIVNATGSWGAPIERRESVEKVHAHYPAAINGVILSNSYYLSANPWGPIIDGVDIFAKAIEESYAAVNYTVHFIDTFFTHHMGGGEVHCGSNVWREIKPATWW